MIKLKSVLLDESTLFITELYIENIRKYSYHWQNDKNELIARWDNQPHWKNIETFPHHKHEKDKIKPSDAISVEDIINVIKSRLK